MKIKHPGWECCTRPDLLIWWVRFQMAWTAERLAMACDMQAQAGRQDQRAHGSAWGVAQSAMIRQGHAERVAKAHGIKINLA